MAEATELRGAALELRSLASATAQTPPKPLFSPSIAPGDAPQ